MKTKRPRVVVNPVASHYQAANERIIEFSCQGPHGARGGLISFRALDHVLVVELYNLDGVLIKTPTPRGTGIDNDHRGPSGDPNRWNRVD
jgi:hypothetical protein